MFIGGSIDRRLRPSRRLLLLIVPVVFSLR